MGDCCDRGDYEKPFGDRFARRVAQRYDRRGLNRTRQRLVDFLVDQEGLQVAGLNVHARQIL